MARGGPYNRCVLGGGQAREAVGVVMFSLAKIAVAAHNSLNAPPLPCPHAVLHNNNIRDARCWTWQCKYGCGLMSGFGGRGRVRGRPYFHGGSCVVPTF